MTHTCRYCPKPVTGRSLMCWRCKETTRDLGGVSCFDEIQATKGRIQYLSDRMESLKPQARRVAEWTMGKLQAQLREMQ